MIGLKEKMLNNHFNSTTEIKKRQQMLVFNLITVVSDYRYYCAGTEEPALYGGSYDYTSEERLAEIRCNGADLVSFVQEVISHQKKIQHSDNKAVKEFRKAGETDSRFRTIYSVFKKMDKEDLRNPQKILRGLEKEKLLLVP